MDHRHQVHRPRRDPALFGNGVLYRQPVPGPRQLGRPGVGLYALDLPPQAPHQSQVVARSAPHVDHPARRSDRPLNLEGGPHPHARNRRHRPAQLPSPFRPDRVGIAQGAVQRPYDRLLGPAESFENPGDLPGGLEGEVGLGVQLADLAAQGPGIQPDQPAFRAAAQLPAAGRVPRPVCPAIQHRSTGGSAQVAVGVGKTGDGVVGHGVPARVAGVSHGQPTSGSGSIPARRKRF